MDEITLEFYYSRFGALAKPYYELIGFDYNRVYLSYGDIIQDFKIHGWKLVNKKNNFYTFQKGD